MNRLEVGLVAGGAVTWTADGDGLTGFDVHPSGALFVYTGVDQPPKAVYSFGVWTVLEVDGVPSST